MPNLLHAHPLRPTKRFSSAVASLCAAVIVVIGVYAVTASHAATNELYLTPENGSVLVGDTIQVAVYANSGTEAYNAVEADLSYDTTQLQYMGYSNTGSPLSLDAQSSDPSQPSNGTIMFARSVPAPSGGNPATRLTGTNLVTTVTFKALAGAGDAAITFASTSAVLDADDSHNLVTSTGSSVITLTSPATPTPTPTATPTATPTSTPTPTATPTPTPTPTPTSTPASGPTGLYLTPASGSYSTGQTLDVAVRVHSDTPVNAVGSKITYDSTKLRYVTFSNAGSPLSLDAQSSQTTDSNFTPGLLQFARSIPAPTGGAQPANVTGDALVETLTFTVIGTTSGTTAVSFANGSEVLSGLDSTNILSTIVGSTFSIVGSGGATPTATPTPTPTPGGTTTITVPPTGTAPPRAVTGKITVVTPTNGLNATTTYEVDGSSVPSASIDTTDLSNGTHIITSITTDPTGKTKSSTQPIAVSNQLTAWQKARNTVVAAFGGHAGVALGTIIVIGLLMVVSLAYVVIHPRLQAKLIHDRLMGNARPVTTTPASEATLIQPTDPHDPTNPPAA